MVQDIQNRNDQQKQIQALTEQQNAEFHGGRQQLHGEVSVAERADGIPNTVTPHRNPQPCVHYGHVRQHLSHISRQVW